MISFFSWDFLLWLIEKYSFLVFKFFIPRSYDESFVSLFLASNETSKKLVNEVFTVSSYGRLEENYDQVFSAHNKMFFVKGTLAKLVNEFSKFKAWERVNNVVLGWLIGVMIKLGVVFNGSLLLLKCERIWRKYMVKPHLLNYFCYKKKYIRQHTLRKWVLLMFTWKWRVHRMNLIVSNLTQQSYKLQQQQQRLIHFLMKVNNCITPRVSYSHKIHGHHIHTPES